MPSFRNSFIDPKRSYLRFDFKLNSAASRVFRSSVAPFRRMTIRDSRGTILEDITEYNHWVKVKDVLKTSWISAVIILASCHIYTNPHITVGINMFIIVSNLLLCIRSKAQSYSLPANGYTCIHSIFLR